MPTTSDPRRAPRTVRASSLRTATAAPPVGDETTPANVRAMVSASRTRSEAKAEAARTAILSLKGDGLPVTYAAVARLARVSREFLYGNAELAAWIEREREASPTRRSSVPVEEQATIASLKARLRNAEGVIDGLRRRELLLVEEITSARTRIAELENQLDTSVQGKGRGRDRRASSNHRRSVSPPATAESPPSDNLIVNYENANEMGDG